MDVVYFLLPAAILLGLLALGGFLWASSAGQFDDLKSPKYRMLFDDEPANDQKTTNSSVK